VGDSETKVLQGCGSPSLEDKGQWFYEKGPTQVMSVISIRDGRVTDLEVQDD
jgi:hypothetical protein